MKKLSLIIVLFLSSVVLSAQEKQLSKGPVGAIYIIKSIDNNISKITYGDEESYEEKIEDTSLCGQRIFVRKKNYDDTKPDSVYIYNFKGECQGYKVSQYYVNERENTVTIQILGDKRNGLIKFIGQDSVVVHIPEDSYLITWSGKL
jgi:hypothetical protein